MKTIHILPLALFCLGTLVNAQSTLGRVGINTSTPRTTMDVVARYPTSQAEGLQPPHISRADLITASVQYTATQAGSIVFVNALGGTPTTKEAKIDATGYYWYDAANSEWQKIGSGAVVPDTNPWFTAGTTTPDNTITNNIYRTGSIGVGLAANATPRYRIQSNGSILIGNQAVTMPDFNALYISNDDGSVQNTFRSDVYADDWGFVAESNPGAARGTSISFKTNTPGAANVGYSLRISQEGHVGIGLRNNNNFDIPFGTNPLHVGVGRIGGAGNGLNGGAIRIEDGNQGVGKVLTSDAQGVGKWMNALGAVLNKTAQQSANYTATATDDIIDVASAMPAGQTLTFPTTGISVGKKYYVINRSANSISVSPTPVTTQQSIPAGSSITLMYLGGTEYAQVSGL